MQLVQGCISKAPRNGSPLDFGLQNFELVDHTSYQHSGQKISSLVEQTGHTDHRRSVEKGRFSDDGLTLKQDHTMWNTMDQWRECHANLETVPLLTRTEEGPMSFMVSHLPGTKILLRRKDDPDHKLQSTQIPLGCLGCFSGQEFHAGDAYEDFNRRLHIYANVKNLRFLPISRAESLWYLAAASSNRFNEKYMDVLKMRALETLDVYDDTY
jgi:hypothetical protein